jgi:UDP-sugar transporter A1/2/3
MKMSFLTDDQGQKYIPSTAIFITEIFKVLISIIFFLFTTSNPSQLKFPSIKMALPALLYTIQNNILYIAINKLDTATFQITYQLKIFSTALFSSILLKKKLFKYQWIAIILLIIGVSMVQYTSLTPSSSNSNWWGLIDDQENVQNRLLGFICVFLASILSGFAGSSFELLLKNGSTKKQNNIWSRNIELGLYACLLSFSSMFIQDYNLIQENGILFGYNRFTWYVILAQAIGGIIVSLVVKYADSIVKSFATCFSIILSGLISFYLEIPGSKDNIYDPMFQIGGLIVICSVILYSWQYKEKKKVK